MRRLKPLENRRLGAGMHIVKGLATTRSVVAKPVRSTHANNVPNNSAATIDRIVKAEPCSEIYGSLAMKSKSFAARRPEDIDVVVSNPIATATKISHQLRQKGYKTKVNYNKEYNSAVVQVLKNGEYVDAVDLHPSNLHYVKYETYGESLPPTNIKGVRVQTATDQLLRKANSVMSYNDEDKRLGPADHRRVKDVSDFITTSRLLLDSKQLRAEAEIARVKKTRKKLSVWKRHLRSLEGYTPRNSKVGRDPIPEYKEQQFIKFAVNNPEVNIKDIYFSGTGIKVRKHYKDIQHCNIRTNTARTVKDAKSGSKKKKCRNNWGFEPFRGIL